MFIIRAKFSRSLFIRLSATVQAASAALHSSDMVALRPRSLPVLNWRFLIFSANSMPIMVTAAFSNRSKPQHRSNSLFDSPMALFNEVVQYWPDRTLTLRASSPVSFISRTARCDTA